MMSTCIIAAQAVMLPIAILVGRKADVWARKPVILVGFAIPGSAFRCSTVSAPAFSGRSRPW